MIDELMPPWAIGKTDCLCVGAQLCTRDGRVSGNAVVVSVYSGVCDVVFAAVTVAGTPMNLTERELDEFFYPPVWVMDPATHPGVVRLSLAG